MRLNRRQFAMLGGALALELATGCSGAGRSGGTQDATTFSPGITGEPAPISVSAAKPPAGVPQALRSTVARGAAGSPPAAGAGLNDLGASLLQLMPAAGNAVLSPYSIYAVLAMARAGAKGKTAAQLDAVLGPFAAQGGNVTAIDRAIAKALANGRPPTGGSSSQTDMRPVAVEVANSLWTQPGLGVRQPYLDDLAAGFGVGMFEIDFAADPEAARQAVNEWVSDHTGKLIAELIARGVIDKSTVLALVNAMRLSAPWQEPSVLTGQPLPFAAPTGTVQATGMGLTGYMMTTSGPGWSAVMIPYRGNGVAMTVVLPDAGSFAKVRGQLGSAMELAVSDGKSDGVGITMPTFKCDSHLSLKSTMKVLGVVDLFGTSADLSGIAGRPGDLVAGDLVHQSVISVDEKGTEAAAATALLATASSAFAAQRQFTVDRPFFYSVHDTVTGAPLFLGQVTDPTA